MEWPAFAVLGAVVWWHLVHDDPETVGARGLARLRAAHAVQASASASASAEPEEDGRQRRADDAGAAAEEVDDEMRAYNEYLASLADRPKTWLRR